MLNEALLMPKEHLLDQDWGDLNPWRGEAWNICCCCWGTIPWIPQDPGSWIMSICASPELEEYGIATAAEFAEPAVDLLAAHQATRPNLCGVMLATLLTSISPISSSLSNLWSTAMKEVKRDMMLYFKLKSLISSLSLEPTCDSSSSS